MRRYEGRAAIHLHTRHHNAALRRAGTVSNAPLTVPAHRPRSPSAARRKHSSGQDFKREPTRCQSTPGYERAPTRTGGVVPVASEARELGSALGHAASCERAGEFRYSYRRARFSRASPSPVLHSCFCGGQCSGRVVLLCGAIRKTDEQRPGGDPALLSRVSGHDCAHDFESILHSESESEGVSERAHAFIARPSSPCGGLSLGSRIQWTRGDVARCTQHCAVVQSPLTSAARRRSQSV